MITAYAPDLSRALAAEADPWSNRRPPAHLSPEERLRVLEDWINRIEAAETDPSPLVAPALQDPAPTVASSAALAYVTLSPPRGDDLAAAARVLIECLELGRARSPGGVFAGLVAVGDRRILRTVFEERGVLRRWDMSDLAQTKTRFLHAASIEFWMDWLDTLPGDETDPFFGTVAAALVNERLQALLPFVDDIERVYPAWLAPDEPVRVVQHWTLNEYVKQIAPRLRAIHAREEEPRVMDDVLMEWGVELD
jgi:hypothetical protein